MNELMQLFYFLGGLALGVDLLGGLAADEGACERHSVS